MARGGGVTWAQGVVAGWAEVVGGWAADQGVGQSSSGTLREVASGLWSLVRRGSKRQLFHADRSSSRKTVAVCYCRLVSASGDSRP